ncbi:MAG: SGNH/GDSL hydrolase family protein [Clostridia bacterium]|nr:SGNH/GDSL hydrolase family protein [Clostridia bacterium]
MKHLSIFGDSILKGVVLNPKNLRYQNSNDFDLEALFSEYGFVLNNQSRFGCTIGKGLTMMRRQLERNAPCDIAIIELGGNDSNFHWDEVAAEPDKEHLPATPLDVFKRLYGKMIDELTAAGIYPVLATLPPLCAERYLDWITKDGLSKANILSWLGDANAIYRYQERYSHVIGELVREKGCAFIDLRKTFLSRLHLHDYYCRDGIHPNGAGQRLILDSLREGLSSIAPVI